MNNNMKEVLIKTNQINNSLMLRKRIVVVTLILGTIFVILGFTIEFYKNSKLLSKYEGKIYPGIYLNDINLASVKLSDLDATIKKEKKNILSGTLTITSSKKDVKFTYKDMGIKIDTDGIKESIIKYNNDLPRFKKVKIIKDNKRNKNFYLKGYFDTLSVDNFIIKLEQTLNSKPRNDNLIVDDEHNVRYDKGESGFTLDTNKTRENIINELSVIKEESVVEAEGTIIKNEVTSSNLSSINKKISTYTTYFNNSGNRGHNITLASSKLNGTILMPNDTFSYLNVVGPYGASNGYKPAPIYLNGLLSTANGGGVCQLASTLYMAQLNAGLETVYKTNHTYAPSYVPKGLDATVYSTTTDYKFKNQYSYPIYISSYVKGNYLTVDIWSNENALGGKTYRPYAIYQNGVYLSYLEEKENDKVINKKYLGKSIYKKR